MKKRQVDEQTLMRSFGLTFDLPSLVPPASAGWHQFVIATTSPLMVRVEATAWLLAPGAGIWIPAGKGCSFANRSRASVRMLYLPVDLLARPFDVWVCRLVSVSPLFRELVNKIVLAGALRIESDRHVRLAALVWDELEDATELQTSLIFPQDPEAVKLLELVEPENFRLGSLARAIQNTGQSKRTLERRFLDETRLSLGVWLRKRRLMLAVEMLSEGKSVGDVAFALGYNGPSAFIAMFRRELGVTPIGYLQSTPVSPPAASVTQLHENQPLTNAYGN